MTLLRTAVLGACLALPAIAAPAAKAAPSDIGNEIRQELAEARKEVRAEMAKARHELQTGNLRVDNSLSFGRHDAAARDLPEAEITPEGDFLVEGEAQEVDAHQRRQLLAYRGRVIGIALAGIEIGEKSAEAALDAVQGSWISLAFRAMTGTLDRKVERMVAEHVQPAVLAICRQLPEVMDAQQELAASLPQFRPYATLDQRDIEECEQDVRTEFAAR